ncbi:hypothetical protein Mahau_1605 [Mahella australiensis 50-1 BON]|jgi:hypothetical protein|uniref:Uncharacterized protein n=1 Tax=Mahella australiensis (strain DSM 15567 / CIP 107919 / 50-1 BON) TaxID=697281 RepID=F3ZZ34_MAHA5|nr:hypothetical protein Mahau_1605 [Mahella australiensis 50-1 BON]
MIRDYSASFDLTITTMDKNGVSCFRSRYLTGLVIDEPVVGEFGIL